MNPDKSEDFSYTHQQDFHCVEDSAVVPWDSIKRIKSICGITRKDLTVEEMSLEESYLLEDRGRT